MSYERHASPITVAGGGSQVSIGGNHLIMGWSLRETTGAAGAVVDIFDGQDATGQILATLSLVASESTRDWLGPDGIETDIGVFVRVNSGAVSGAVWIRERERHPR